MPSSLLLSVGTLFASFLLSPAVAHFGPHSSYQLAEKWHGKSFMENMEFFTAADPTNGYVTYVDQEHAEDAGLFKIQSDGSIYMGVDHTSTLDPNGAGRDSVRVESKKFYKQGLYIVDVAHMPGTICGTWPAFWSVGPRWPQDGEIDIIEGVNMHSGNEIVLHTSGSCSLSPEQDMSGKMSSSECGDASGPIGCVIKGGNGTAGTPLNEKGGGVYAMERTSEFIKIWYFPRESIPKSITNGKPDTSSFGTPMANLQGPCDFEERFKPQKLVFNIDFCGDWAGGIYGQDGCPMSDPNDSFKSCHTYVAQNPEKFKESYWEVNSVQIFMEGFGHHESNGPSTTVTSAINTTPASTVSATQVPENSTTSEVAPTTAPAPTSEASVSSAPETVTPAPDTSAPESTNTPETTPVAPTTTGPVVSATHGKVSKPASRSTVYTTSTTTICKAASNSLAAAAVGGGKPTAIPSVKPTTIPGGDQETPFDSLQSLDSMLPDFRMRSSSANSATENVTPATSSSVPAPTSKAASKTTEIISEQTTICPSTDVPVAAAPETAATSSTSQAVAHVAASSETFAAPASSSETFQTVAISASTDTSQDAAATSPESSESGALPASTDTFQATAAATSSETSQADANPASTDTSQAAPVSTYSEVPVHAPQTSQAVPSRADAVAAIPSVPMSSSQLLHFASTSPATPTSSSVIYASGASGSSSSGPAGALYTGAARRLSVGTFGLISALAMAILV